MAMMGNEMDHYDHFLSNRTNCRTGLQCIVLNFFTVFIHPFDFLRIAQGSFIHRSHWDDFLDLNLRSLQSPSVF